MIIQCEQCKTRFNIEPSKFKGNAQLRLRCSNCGYIFLAQAPPPSQPANIAPLGHVITFCNQKGGVAKTTSCLNIGVALSRLGYRVLCIDFDPQANLSLLVNGTNNNMGSFYDAITSTGQLAGYLQRLPVGLWLLPSNQRMNAFPKYALQTRNSEQILRQALIPLKNQFDFILIDTPPSVKFFTLNALVAADCVVVTTQCTYLSMHGVEQIQHIINAVRGRSGKPKEPKLLLTLYDPNNTAVKAIYVKLQQRFAQRILPYPIPVDNAVPESQILHKALLDYAPQSLATQAYTMIAKQLLTDCEV